MTRNVDTLCRHPTGRGKDKPGTPWRHRSQEGPEPGVRIVCEYTEEDSIITRWNEPLHPTLGKSSFIIKEEVET